MPPKSKAKTGPARPASVVKQRKPRVPAEPSHPSRRSARILRKTEDEQTQLASTTRERSWAEEGPEERGVPSVPKSRKGRTTQKKIDSANIPKRNTTQAPVPKSRKGRTTQKKIDPAKIPKRKTTHAPKTIDTNKATRASPIASAGRKPVLELRNSSVSQTGTYPTLRHRRSEASLTNSSERLTVASDIVEWYHSRGYEVPDEVSMASTINDPKKSSKASSRRSKKAKISSTDKTFTSTLLDHNISNLSERDPKIDYYEQLILEDTSNTLGTLATLEVEIQREINRREDALWKIDMSRCARSNEARFQRTVMMTILNRQELDGKLDYNCEAQWISGRFPCPEPCAEKACQITNPKPDLAVAFLSRSLLPTNGIMPDFERLKIWQSDMFPEGPQEFNNERAFYFFSMEAKGKRGQIDNQAAHFQNLSTASRALFNIYHCMKRVNELETFFDKVRVFFAVATVEGLSLRIHRPIRLESEQCNNEEYPIGFQFDILEHLRGAYSRAQATAIVYNVLYQYGVMKLHPILKDTVQKLLKLHPRKNVSRPSLEDLEKAAAAQAALVEVDPEPASQGSSSRKRRAQDPGSSFNSNSRRRLNNISLSDSSRSTVSVEG